MPSALFVAPSAYTLSGLATWLDFLLPGLRAKGWDARLGLVSGPRFHRPETYLRHHPDERVHVAHCATGTPEGRLRALEKLLAETSPDIAISVNIPDLLAAIARRRSGHKPAPRAVLSVHGIEAFLYADARHYREVLDGVVCTNRLACELTASLGGIKRERICYAAYGVEFPEVVRADSPRRLRIVYSGRLEQSQKRVGDLPDIVRGLETRGIPFALAIAGDGPERESLQSALRSQCEAGTVTFHGQVPIEHLKSDLYPHSDAMIITSSWETGPIVAWEAMAQGLPVVCSRYIGSGLESALVDGENSLLFDIGDSDAASAALANLWLDRDRAARIAHAGSELVRRRYSVPASVRSWDEALASILQRPGRVEGKWTRPTSTGRLDSVLGVALAERARTLLGRSFEPAGPGSEWPHSTTRASSDERFWSEAASTDRAGRGDAMGLAHAL